MDDLYDLQDVLDFNLFDSDVEYSESSGEEPAFEVDDTALPASYLTRSSDYWQQVPLPDEIELVDTNILASLDDETLLGLSPTLIAHIQRTEASHGAQVISPRAMTLGGMAARTNHSHRTTDMFLVGSAASRNMEWPTLDDPVPEHLFYREPIDSYPSDPAARNKTVTAGVLSTTIGIDDPITKAFLVGRALVDLQRRSDVAGSADALSEVLAACWGVDSGTYTDMGEASLAPTGPLLRYAIRTDIGYPVVNAPVQARKSMSVGANTAGRHLYGEYSAIDWRRLRVLAESVFYQSSRLEGWTLADMVTPEPPGNPRARPDRPGILQMRPLPGSVWSFDPKSFRLDIVTPADEISGVLVPQRVRDSVANFHENARPVAIAAAAGANVSYASTLKAEVLPETDETLIRGYVKVLETNAAFSTRGKTAAAAVRNFVYQCLADSTKLSAIRSLWLAKNMHDTVQALNYTHLLDVTTSHHVAARMADITTDLRAKLGVEAGRRGADLGEWWDDMKAQMPREIAAMKEGSGSWAVATAHYMLHPPTAKWSSLVNAMAHASHSVLARSHLRDVRLPAKIGSAERSFEAGSAVVRQLGASYGAYYLAMFDVSNVLAARLARAGNQMGANKVRLAGLMWDIRAKVASTVSFRTEDGTSVAAGYFQGKHATYHLTTAPHSAYTRWHSELNKSPVVRKTAKQGFPHHADPILSKTFEGHKEPVFTINAGASSRLMRYANDPDKLAVDIERTLGEILADAEKIVQYYDEEATTDIADIPPAGEIEMQPLTLDMSSLKPAAGTFWSLLSEMDQDEATEAVDALARMDAAAAAEIENRVFESPMEALNAIWGAQEEIATKKTFDAVV